MRFRIRDGLKRCPTSDLVAAGVACLVLEPLATWPCRPDAWRPIALPASVLAAGLDAGAARHRAGIEGLAAGRATEELM